ncbi:MAG TPA: GMC family oxidoreductase [Polyangiaceae bacterium]|nr:GMC family oxidoreductase [Polyangiaceae bacterium]
MAPESHFDFLIIGSGFGGSVSALRLVEKGYRVAVLEQGSDYSAGDFAKTTWDLRKWLWMPRLGFRGIMQLRFFRDVTVLAGSGVGGGSLGYAATLPTPKASFFQAPGWADLADWQSELAPHYQTARRMLGVAQVPALFPADKVLLRVAEKRGQVENFQVPEVGIYFGDAGRSKPDPFFGGEGPERRGCRFCGACMTGCRHDANNSLDKNYLYLARQRGLTLLADTQVVDVLPAEQGGYRVRALSGKSGFGRRERWFGASHVIFSAGALGSVELLLRLKEKGSLPQLSGELGRRVRTNEESLIAVTVNSRERSMSEGVAIGSLLQTDEHSHIEAVRYGEGSGFWRLLGLPHVASALPGLLKIFLAFFSVLRHPIRFFRAWLVPDWAKYTAILLYMRAFDGSIRFRLRRGPFGASMGSTVDGGHKPRAYMPEASELAEEYAREADGVPIAMFTETLLNVPTTAHLLGGCCMGSDASNGVIDARHRVFGHPGLFVIDGSAVSANPGVNPSLTITALAERAMSFIPPKQTGDVESSSAREPEPAATY